MPSRRGPGSVYRRLLSVKYLIGRDRRAVRRFVFASDLPRFSIRRRVALVRRYIQITNAVRGYHTLTEMLVVAHAILRRAGDRPLTVVEAGCGSGSSSAKLSLAVAAAGGALHVCDSFRGIPENDEQHELLDGRTTVFRRGAFCGNLAAVRRTVERFGAIDACSFHKGWFADTLPALPDRLDVVVLDVDLASATRTCLVELFPRLRGDGVLFSLDGQLRATHAILGDEEFWRDQVGSEPPHIDGLGTDKLLTVRRST